MAYLPDLSYGPDTRIVLVGTTSCPLDMEGLPPVPHAKNNIDYLSRLFTDPDICGLDESCIVRVLDRENASEITDQIAQAAREATDTLLVYYVGHGLYGDTETPLYLAAQKTTEQGKAFNGVSVTLVKRAMRSSPARKRILILDCCYSGQALDGGMASVNREAAVQPAIDIEGTYGIAAVPAYAKALAPPDEKFTRFTGALVDVLEHGLNIDDRVLSLEDVFAEVERKIGRKADAPLPKRINWDQGQKFCIARNRSLHRRELNRLYEAVQGLRDTMMTTGARLQALEAERTQFEELSTRLTEIEKALSQRLAGITSKNKTGTPIWGRLGLQESEWTLLPAQPYKLRVLNSIAGRRNGFILLSILACIVSPAIALIATGSNWPAILSLTALAGFIAFLAFLSLREESTDFASRSKELTSATEFSDKLKSNVHLIELLDRELVDFVTIPIEAPFLFIAFIVALTPIPVALIYACAKLLSPLIELLLKYLSVNPT